MIQEAASCPNLIDSLPYVCKRKVFVEKEIGIGDQQGGILLQDTRLWLRPSKEVSIALMGSEKSFVGRGFAAGHPLGVHQSGFGA